MGLGFSGKESFGCLRIPFRDCSEAVTEGEGGTVDFVGASSLSKCLETLDLFIQRPEMSPLEKLLT